MKAWKQTYETEQTAMTIADSGRKRVDVRLTPCNALAPDSGVTLCMHYLGGDATYCLKVLGHPGPHSRKPSSCNRPHGHDGPHTFVVMRDARVLARWV